MKQVVQMGVGMFGCLAILLVGFTSAADQPDPGRAVVMISVDGLAGFYFDDPKAVMPNIRALAADGARAELMRASTPSVTWPNHTTLVTGVVPARHGVVGNNYFDRATGKAVALISDPSFDKEQIVKVPTIYDLAKAAGMKTLAIRWPASRNAKTLDWTLPDMKAESSAAYTTPALVQEAQAAGLWPKSKDGGIAPLKSASDDFCTALFIEAMTAHRPGFSLLHIIDVDHTEHQYGPRSPEAYASIKASDERVGKVWEAVKRTYPGKATIFIVSDHGFSPINRIVLPNVILRDAGLIETKGKGLKVVGGQVSVVVQGGSAMIYILDETNKAKISDQIKQQFSKVEEVASVVDTDHLKDYGVATPQADPHAPDMILFAKEGYAFGDTVAGTMTFQEKPERRGTHGHDVNLPHLHATFVAWGSGIKPGAKLGIVQNTDVAPTIAALLHLSMPDVDGHVLKDALAE